MATKEWSVKELEEVLQKVADKVSGSIYKNYSGRSMYGSKCYGVVCDSFSSCIEAAAALGLRGSHVDSMGVDYIVYWPNLTMKQ